MSEKIAKVGYFFATCQVQNTEEQLLLNLPNLISLRRI